MTARFRSWSFVRQRQLKLWTPKPSQSCMPLLALLSSPCPPPRPLDTSGRSLFALPLKSSPPLTPSTLAPSATALHAHIFVRADSDTLLCPPRPPPGRGILRRCHCLGGEEGTPGVREETRQANRRREERPGSRDPHAEGAEVASLECDRALGLRRHYSPPQPPAAKAAFALRSL